MRATATTPPWSLALLQRVRWAGGDPEAQPYRVLQRRVTESLARTWREYLLSSERFPGREAVWASDSACEPWEEEKDGLL